MFNQEEYKKNVKKHISRIKKDMKALNVYRKQFELSITVYAEMLVQLDVLTEKWVSEGCPIVETYVNKSGAETTRKSSLYAAIESVRRDIRSREDALGMTPYGVKKINDEMKKKEKHEGLEGMLQGIGKEV